MNPVMVTRLALSELRGHPGRTLLPGLALLVGVACLIASMMLGDAMSDAVKAGAERVPQSVGVVVSPNPSRDGNPADLDQVAKQLAGVPGVAKVVPVQQVGVDVLGVDGRALPYRVSAAIDSGDPSLNRFALQAGRTPAADGEVAIDKVTAYQRHLAPGTHITLADAGGRPVQVTVSGVLQLGGKADMPFLVVGKDLATKLDPTFDTSELDLLLTPGTSDITARANITQQLGTGFSVRTGDGERTIQGGDNTVRVLLLLFSILALATSMFVAGATFRAVYLQRQRQTALLRCVGAERSPIVWANLIEALITGAMAGAVGALLSGGVARLLAWILDVTGVSTMIGATQLQPAVLPSIGYLITGILVAAALSAFAAVRPSLAAARVSPLAALRLAGEATPERRTVRARTVRGWLFVGAAVVFALGALATQRSVGSPFFALFSGIAAVAGVFGSFGPRVVPFLGRGIGWVAGKVFGPHVRLAGVELGRVPQRAASVAIPLVLASAIVAGAVVLIGTAHDLTLSRPDPLTPDAQISDTGHRPLGPDVLKAAQQPEVQQLLPVSGAGNGVTVNGTRMRVSGVDPAKLDAYLTALHQPAAPKLGPDTALVDSWRLEDNKLKIGQQVTVGGLTGGPRTVTIVGTTPQADIGYSDLLVGDPGLAPVSAVFVDVKPGSDQAAYRSAVLAALPDAPTVTVDTAAQNNEDTQRNLDLAAVMLMVLLGLSVAVAVTGIGTAMSISVQERRKEVALRRALGVTRMEVTAGILAEAVLLALSGLIGGTVLGAVYAELLIAGMGVHTWPSLPWGQLAIGGLVVVALAVLAAVMPARTASRVVPAAGLAGS
ncbi:FtsX-like permease family protein [Kutzneria sp. NPDC052558]|uniref:FtsX-like permease family protein n=1 Tax=Kutzneria sp. NPDC052558 TaxID=3364121 RepID=UPI0037CB82E6